MYIHIVLLNTYSIGCGAVGEKFGVIITDWAQHMFMHLNDKTP